MEPNWQPGPEMLALMEALANESGDVFRRKRRDYLYLTAGLQLHHTGPLDWAQIPSAFIRYYTISHRRKNGS